MGKTEILGHRQSQTSLSTYRVSDTNGSVTCETDSQEKILYSLQGKVSLGYCNISPPPPPVKERDSFYRGKYLYSSEISTGREHFQPRKILEAFLDWNFYRRGLTKLKILILRGE